MASSGEDEGDLGVARRQAWPSAGMDRRRSVAPGSGSRPSRKAGGRRQTMAGEMDGLNQMLVTVRTRPLSNKEVARGDSKVVTSFCVDKVVRISKAPRRQGAVLKSEMGAQHEYQFDNVFGNEATQQDVYDVTTRDIVRETLEGKNCTVFAYGATGAGKTHTMMGLPQDPGIIPRALVDVFAGINAKQAKFSANAAENETYEWSVKLSYLEVYNECIYDLIAETQRPLQPCEDPTDGRVKVLGLKEVKVTTTEQVLQLLEQGNSRRRMESTAANAVSSRSHAVMQINLECVHEQNRVAVAPGKRRLAHEQGRRTTTSSTLSLIDLAGSERAAATLNRGARLREGANINKSLLALANCINALSSKKGNSRVKYRDSKLTHLLKSSLEGKCRLSMIAAINPSHRSYEESHNTLKYANRAKNIKVKESINRRDETLCSEEALRMENLVAENQQLRERLSLSVANNPRGPPPTLFSPGAISSISEADKSMERMSIADDESPPRAPVNAVAKSPIVQFASPPRQQQQRQQQENIDVVLQALRSEAKALKQVIEQQKEQLKLKDAHIATQGAKIQELEERLLAKEREDHVMQHADEGNENKQSNKNSLMRRDTAGSEYLFTTSEAPPSSAPCQPQPSGKPKKSKSKSRRQSFIPKPPKATHAINRKRQSLEDAAGHSKKRLSSDGNVSDQGPKPTKQQKVELQPSAPPLVDSAQLPFLGQQPHSPALPPNHHLKKKKEPSSRSPFARFTQRLRKER